MSTNRTRRGFLQMAGAAVAASAVSAGQAAAGEPAGKLKIIAVACSPRKGKTTAQALQICLDAARAVDPEQIEVELIELAGLKIPAYLAAGLPLEPGDRDDFPQVAEKLGGRDVAGILVGSPVYFCGMSALCKAFLDRCMSFRARKFALGGKVAGVVAVGGVRNGGQELTIQSIQAALLCQELLIVGDGRPTAHTGATLLNTDDDISGDEFGVTTARNLGRHLAEVALRQSGR